MEFTRSVFYCILLFICLAFFSCTAAKYGQPLKAPTYILSSFNNFWAYWNDEVKLSRDFISLDENEQVISNDTFFKKISEEDYLPLVLKSTDSFNYYKLYKLTD